MGFGWSLLACCPAAALIGVVLGAIGWWRVRASSGQRRGAGLAAAAVIVSLVLGCVSLVVGARLQGASEAKMVSEIRSAVNQLLGSDLDPSAWWSGVSVEELLAFRERVRDEIGSAEVTSVTITNSQLGLPMTASFRILLESEQARRVGSVDAQLASDPSTWLPSVRLTAISIGTGDGDGLTNPLPLDCPAKIP
ncbi:MAG: hypothetical protein EXS03_05960 [Phycisphaerales bacterium]|nr:hypothetical protein [Phycisphaerales bacterium]